MIQENGPNIARFALHGVQALILTSVTGLGHMIFQMNDKLNAMDGHVTVLADHIQGVENQLKDAQLPEMNAQISTLKADDAWLQRQVLALSPQRQSP